MRLRTSGGAMFGRETRMLLRHYLEQGSSKSELARQLGVSRDTIHRWIRDGNLDRDVDAEAVRYGPVPSWRRLDGPTADHRDRASRPIPRCRPCGSSTSVRAAGYTGGYSQLDDAGTGRVRPTRARAARALRDSAGAGAGRLRGVRFPWGTRYALLVVLGYSRLPWCLARARPCDGDEVSRTRSPRSAACRASCCSIR